MTRKEFIMQFKELCDYYKDSTYNNEKITQLYYNQVKNMSIEEFKDKCDSIMISSKFMPKIAEFASSNVYRGRHYTKEFLNQFYSN